MRRLPVPQKVLAFACIPLCALGVTACASTTSTSGFKGAEHEAAQTVADLQSDVTSSDRKKICERDFAAPVVSRLGGVKACETAVKNRIAEIDNTELQVESVKVAGNTATAQVKSVYGGNKRIHTVTLAKEASRWKITAIG
jgi:hypothetical protein